MKIKGRFSKEEAVSVKSPQVGFLFVWGFGVCFLFVCFVFLWVLLLLMILFVCFCLWENNIIMWFFLVEYCLLPFYLSLCEVI